MWSPVKGFWPVSISYARTPSEKMSVRGSRSSPRICSGARYEAVPSVIPVCVSVDWETIDFAMPKSMIFTVPSSRMRMFDGLMSRWMMPVEWA